MSPLLTEAYFEIAEKALDRAIVDPKSKPAIQNFRVDLGARRQSRAAARKAGSRRRQPAAREPDVLVTQLTPTKPFAFEPFFMRTKYRFIEGYRGNDTVRGWRDYDSIYHAVFADMRGSGGLSERQAPTARCRRVCCCGRRFPTEEMFESDGTYGPKANFKISLRELPDEGPLPRHRHRGEIQRRPAARSGRDAAQTAERHRLERSVRRREPSRFRKAGIYQVDIYAAENKPSGADASRLKEGLAGIWPRTAMWRAVWRETPSPIDSPVGKALSLDGGDDSLIVPRNACRPTTR